MEWKTLQSGSDIRGTAIGGRMQLTDEVVEKITYGFVEYLSEKLGVLPRQMTICVGTDSRISAPRIKDAVIRVLQGCGVQVWDCGLSSTPAMFLTTVDLSCTAAIEITASHLPYDQNGIKFFTASGGLTHDEIGEVLSRAAAVSAVPVYRRPAPVLSYMTRYAKGLRDMIQKELGGQSQPLKDLHIVVDAGNGVGGFFPSQVLSPLGADVSGSQFLEPDGYFPHHSPNPENADAMEALCQVVVSQKADFGVMFDTDVDRAACVDSDGSPIHRNRMIALTAAMVLDESPKATIITDSVASDGLCDFVEELGGNVMRYRRGYQNVIRKAKELNENGVDCPLAMETSGHAALREHYFLDDGAYLMAKVIVKLAKLRRQNRDISVLLSALKEPIEEQEYRFRVTDESSAAYADRILSDMKAYCRRFPFLREPTEWYEGVCVWFDASHGDGRMLLRRSVHEPMLVLNLESNSQGGVPQLLAFARDFLSRYDGLVSQP